MGPDQIVMRLDHKLSELAKTKKIEWKFSASIFYFETKTDFLFTDTILRIFGENDWPKRSKNLSEEVLFEFGSFRRWT